MDSNILLSTDSYKISHYLQYPPGTRNVFSFFESRGGRYPEIVFFGLQYLIKKHLIGQVVTEEKISDAKELCAAHFGNASMFNEAGWRRILDVHQGRLPLEIRAIPEGTRIPVSNALITVVNTDDAVPWLTNYVETLLVQAWYPTTVATQSSFMKQSILKYLEETGTPADVGFKLHDFGYRGSTSAESAGIGGAAHLVNFKGTDTIETLRVARHYYGESMAGFSIPAAEHSTITSWGKSREADAYANMLAKYPTGLVAVVSDSYDIFNACRNLWGGELREKVLHRDGVLVIRPDSGEAIDVLPKVLNILGQQFGSARNAKGYKTLESHVRLIQGDGIDYQSIAGILEALKRAGWSADNIAFGSGGGLLQKVDRDTQKFAFKCSAVNIDGVWHEVMKDPVTDSGKRSKAGRLSLIRVAGKPKTTSEPVPETANLLKPVFRNGELLEDQKFADIRARAAS